MLYTIIVFDPPFSDSLSLRSITICDIIYIHLLNDTASVIQTRHLLQRRGISVRRCISSLTPRLKNWNFFFIRRSDRWRCGISLRDLLEMRHFLQRRGISVRRCISSLTPRLKNWNFFFIRRSERWRCGISLRDLPEMRHLLQRRGISVRRCISSLTPRLKNWTFFFRPEIWSLKMRHLS